ncbi:MAG: asparaginase [Halobacteriaceae archaeon]
MTRVHVLSTGGTIASTAGEGGATPSLSGSDLVEAAPGLADDADVSVEEVAERPGFDVDPATMAAVRRRAAAVADDVAGVVVTHGTDTLAETALFLDLTLRDVPAVVTGAQRRPDETSADGPANLVTAVRAAAHPRIEGGAYVAFNDELHAGRDAVKAHTHRLDAFRSPNAGPVAVFQRDSVGFYREPGPRSVGIPEAGVDATVEVVVSGAGVGARQIESALAAGVDGLVLAGTGLGNATAALGDAVGEAVAAGLPVVVTSRCHAGATAAVYGTAGGGVTLRDHGAIDGGDLHPWKARIKLLLALGHAETVAGVRDIWTEGV